MCGCPGQVYKALYTKGYSYVAVKKINCFDKVCHDSRCNRP